MRGAGGKTTAGSHARSLMRRPATQNRAEQRLWRPRKRMSVHLTTAGSPSLRDASGVRALRDVDLGRATRDALAAARLATCDVDAVVVATASSAYRFPSLACLLHERLGLAGAPAF